MTKRCDWVPEGKDDYIIYHDNEWGVPVHDDQLLFEMLILEGAQAGLSWYTILKRRDGYRKAFNNFDPVKCSNMTDTELKEILKTANIIRNRLKVFSVRKNAQAFLAIQQEFGTFDKYLWQFVGNQPKVNKPKTLKEVPYSIIEAKTLSKDLKKRGMGFVGEGIIYAYMQAVGMVNDHMESCFKTTGL